MSTTKMAAAVGASALAVVLSGAAAVWAFPLASPADPGGAASAAPAAEKKAGFPRAAVHKAPTVYPEQAKKDGVEGDVVLEITIEKTGEVSAAHAVSGPEVLRAAAETSLRQWRYVASDVGPVNATVTIRFKLDSKAGKKG